MKNFLTTQMMSSLVLLFLSFAGIIHGITLPANIDKAKIDEEIRGTGPHYPFVPRSTIVVADSSTEYTMWTQMQECLAYNPLLGYLEFTCRNITNGNYLDVGQTDSAFSFTVTDLGVYNAQLGGARYPTSVASDDGTGNGPHISFPFLFPGPQWGGMGGQYESGGWFSSFWNTAVDVGPGNLGTHKNIGKQLPNTDILFIGVTADDQIRYSTWSYDLSTMRANGVLAPATAYYWGYDVNGGIA